MMKIITCTLGLLRLLESLTDEGGEEYGVPGENPDDKLQKITLTTV